MINFDNYTNVNKTEHNLKRPYIPDHPYRILISAGSRKTNALLNLINNQADIDKINLYAKDPHEAKYQLLISERESSGLKHFNDPKAFIEYNFTFSKRIVYQRQKIKHFNCFYYAIIL